MFAFTVGAQLHPPRLRGAARAGGGHAGGDEGPRGRHTRRAHPAAPFSEEIKVAIDNIASTYTAVHSCTQLYAAAHNVVPYTT